MKVKNLMIGAISKIEYMEIPMEDYYPSSFDDKGNMPVYLGESVFYRLGNHAYDIINFRRYKLVKEQEYYPDNLRGKKVVMFQQPFSDLSIRDSISRHDAILLYRNKRIK